MMNLSIKEEVCVKWLFNMLTNNGSSCVVDVCGCRLQLGLLEG